MSVRVLLADDIEIVRRAIRGLLEDEAGIEIVGEASDLSQTLRMAQTLNPHVVVLDLHMPNPTNLAPLGVKASLAGTRLLAISVFADEDTKAMADSFGAVALLDKMKLGSELITAIFQVGLGSKAVAASCKTQTAASSAPML
jgi:DNA-binding NarL/FixJ family response regulator